MGKTIATENAWLEQGLIGLGKYGIRGLNIEAMSRRLHCSKSGFYWYFGDRKKYLNRLMLYWRETETEAFFIEAETEAAETPQARFVWLFRRIGEHRKYGDLLFHLRSLSRKMPTLKNAILETENVRIKYLVDLFMDLGNDLESSKSKAEIIYHFYLGWYERNKDEKPSKSEINRHLASLAKILNLGLESSHGTQFMRENAL